MSHAMSWPARCTAAVVIGLAVPGWAVAAVATELQQIAAERAAANARFAERERVCRLQFVVTACIDDARQEHRATLNRLRRSEIEFTDQRRRAAAAARQSEIDARVAEQAKRFADESAPTPRRPAGREAVPHKHEPAAGSTLLPRSTPPRRSAADQQAIERSNVAKFEARQRAAQARREEIERRNAARASKGKLPAPLPPPLPTPVTPTPEKR